MSDRLVKMKYARFYGYSWGLLILFIILITLTIPNQYAKMFRGIAFAYDGPLLIASACLALLFFLCLSFRSRWINNISEGAFAVYLFHENAHVSSFYKNIVMQIFTNSNGILTMLLIMFFGISIMFAVFAVDYFIRKPIQTFLQPRIQLVAERLSLIKQIV